VAHLEGAGPKAPGGAYSYVINGNMIAGLRTAGRAGDHRNTGVMSFMVSNHGKVYEKDLGPDTALRRGGDRRLQSGRDVARSRRRHAPRGRGHVARRRAVRREVEQRDVLLTVLVSVLTGAVDRRRRSESPPIGMTAPAGQPVPVGHPAGSGATGSTSGRPALADREWAERAPVVLETR